MERAPAEVDDISTGGERELPMKDGSMLALGYAPTKHTVKFMAKTDLSEHHRHAPGTAHRSQSARRRSRPLDQRAPARSPSSRWKRAADAPDKFEKIKIASATADLNLPETVLEPKFDDKSGKRRVTGPVEFAIDGNDETAWGIDAGPGLRNQSRKAVFDFEKPVIGQGTSQSVSEA